MNWTLLIHLNGWIEVQLVLPLDEWFWWYWCNVKQYRKFVLKHVLVINVFQWYSSRVLIGVGVTFLTSQPLDVY